MTLDSYLKVNNIRANEPRHEYNHCIKVHKTNKKEEKKVHTCPTLGTIEKNRWLGLIIAITCCKEKQEKYNEMLVAFERHVPVSGTLLL